MNMKPGYLPGFFGVVMETRARIEWLTIVRKFVANPLPLGSDWAETISQQLDSFSLSRISDQVWVPSHSARSTAQKACGLSCSKNTAT